MSATQRNAQFEALLARLLWIEDKHGCFTAYLEGEEQHDLFGIWEVDGRWFIEGSFVPLQEAVKEDGPLEPPSFDTLDQAKAAAGLYLSSWMLRRWDDIEAVLLQDSPQASAQCSVLSAQSGWQPIETAPKDGKRIDVWCAGEYPQRWADVYWGKPDHCCGEMGQYCDSDWHSLKPGWVDALEMPVARIDARRLTHWMPIPSAPGKEEAS